MKRHQDDEHDEADDPEFERDRHVAQQIEDLHPSEGAAILSELPTELSADVSEYLDPNTAARVLTEMDPALAATVIQDMETPEASMVLSAMDPDDRVDILEKLPESVHDVLLSQMPAEDVDEIRRLEAYPADTAGGIMTTDVTALTENLTVGQAIEELRALSETREQMFYVYVVDQRNHIVGVLSMRDLILARPDRRLSAIMRTEVRTVPATMDQEEVARLFREYDYLAMPVVDERGRLIGLITVDDVVDVMQEEATEDVHRMFGAGVEERLTSPWQFSFRKRVWWLVINLGTAFMAAAVVGMFQHTIETLAILAAYMPVVAGMGGNAGAQSLAVTIRGISVGKVDRNLLRHILVKEAMVGVLTGVTLGLITAGVCMAFNRNPELGLVVGLALLINHTLACTTGALIPYGLKRLGFDPAQSATIFATTITDVVGFFCLLGLAQIILHPA